MSDCNCNKSIIILRQGDDTNFNGNTITINMNTKIDLTGWTAIFQLQDLKINFDDISNKKINLVISQEQTNKLEAGDFNGWIKLQDKEGRQCTVYTHKFRVLRRRVF